MSDSDSANTLKIYQSIFMNWRKSSLRLQVSQPINSSNRIFYIVTKTSQHRNRQHHQADSNVKEEINKKVNESTPESTRKKAA